MWWKVIKKSAIHPVFIRFLLPGIPSEDSPFPFYGPLVYLCSQCPNGASYYIRKCITNYSLMIS